MYGQVRLSYKWFLFHWIYVRGRCIRNFSRGGSVWRSLTSGDATAARIPPSPSCALPRSWLLILVFNLVCYLALVVFKSLFVNERAFGKMIELSESVVSVIDGAIAFVYSFQPIAEKTVVLGAFSLSETSLSFPSFCSSVRTSSSNFSAWHCQGTGVGGCRYDWDGFRDCLLCPRNVCLLSARYDYGPDSVWSYPPLLLVLFRSIPASIDFGSTMDSSFH